MQKHDRSKYIAQGFEYLHAHTLLAPQFTILSTAKLYTIQASSLIGVKSKYTWPVNYSTLAN
jgi:hypothetical protein